MQVKKTSSDGDNYWIPKILLSSFDEFSEFLCDKEYLEYADYFDLFETTFSIFETGGDESLKPDYFNDIENIEFI